MIFSSWHPSPFYPPPFPILKADVTFLFFLTKHCNLQPPCMVRSPRDLKEKLIHKGFQSASLIYCHVHGNVVDAHDICEECLFSFAMREDSSPKFYKFLIRKLGLDRRKSPSMNSCSCCCRSSLQQLAKPFPLPLPSISPGPDTVSLHGPLRRRYRNLSLKTRSRVSTPSTPLVFSTHDCDFTSRVGFTNVKISSDFDSDHNSNRFESSFIDLAPCSSKPVKEDHQDSPPSKKVVQLPTTNRQSSNKNAKPNDVINEEDCRKTSDPDTSKGVTNQEKDASYMFSDKDYSPFSFEIKHYVDKSFEDPPYLQKTQSQEVWEVLAVDEIEGETPIDRLRRQVDHDRETIMNLYTELDEERNAAAEAASQAMAKITKLQDEKAELSMHVEHYLRIMEEQVVHDGEALERAYGLIAEKEEKMRGLEEEVEFYRMKYMDEYKEETLKAELRQQGMGVIWEESSGLEGFQTPGMESLESDGGSP